jgi:hypothetical protein
MKQQTDRKIEPDGIQLPILEHLQDPKHRITQVIALRASKSVLTEILSSTW